MPLDLCLLHDHDDDEENDDDDDIMQSESLSHSINQSLSHSHVIHPISHFLQRK